MYAKCATACRYAAMFTLEIAPTLVNVKLLAYYCLGFLKAVITRDIEYYCAAYEHWKHCVIGFQHSFPATTASHSSITNEWIPEAPTD